MIALAAPLTAAIIGLTFIVLGRMCLRAQGAHVAFRLEERAIEAEGEAAQEALTLAEGLDREMEVLRKRINVVAEDARKASLGRMGGRR